VTGDHLSFDGNCGVHPKATNGIPGGGRSNGVKPSLSSASHFMCPCRLAGVEAPRTFMASHTYGELSLTDRARKCIAPPAVPYHFPYRFHMPYRRR
jgi:hypothetical protein